MGSTTVRDTSRGSLLGSLLSARGNARACIYTEPLWGIPYHLFVPFMPVYMVALGMSHAGIGMVATVGLALQMVASAIGGPLTDRMGRRLATVVFDLVSWSVPALLWAFARSPAWFYAAAALNALLRIPVISWTCLLVEDAPRAKMVHYWTWVMVAGLLAGFVTPVAGLLIDRFELVPTMRAIYLFAFVSMTAKFVILYATTEEPAHGILRRRETAGRSILSLTAESLRVVRLISRDRGTMAALAALVMSAVYATVRGAFFAIYLTAGLSYSPQEIGWFPALRSLVMLVFYFVVIPRLHQERYVGHLLAGVAGMIVGTVGLLMAPERGTGLVVAATVVEACGAALLAPYLEGFITVVVDPEERARVLAIANTVVLAVASPFGWIAGVLSERSPALPFVLLAVVLGVTSALLLLINPERRPRRRAHR